MTTNVQNDFIDHRANGRSNTDSHEIKDDYNFHDASFRRHYQLNYVDGGRDYEEFYAPAYRFGYELAQQHGGDTWEAVQEEAQSHWQAHHPSAWPDIAEAVHYGWREQREPQELRVDHHGSYGDMRPSFEKHYANTFTGADATFGHYSPAYEYGYTLAVDPDHRTRLWDDLEPTVREYWREEYDEHLPWEHYRDAARHAWYTARGGNPGV